jgi:hypothetical protein
VTFRKTLIFLIVLLVNVKVGRRGIITLVRNVLLECS